MEDRSSTNSPEPAARSSRSTLSTAIALGSRRGGSSHPPQDSRPWSRSDVDAQMRSRADSALAATEIAVDYYRVGYRLTFPLPVDTRPVDFPRPIPGIRQYPWLIWLGWELEERWHTLHSAQQLGDQAAGALLWPELAGLDGWSTFDADEGRAGLITATLAGALAEFLSHNAGSEPAAYAAALGAARRLLTTSIGPWHRDEPAAESLHNIRMITLLRGAQLAEVLDDDLADELRSAAVQAFRSWLAARERGHSEGVGYDGYLLYHACAWLESSAAGPELRDAARAELLATARSWAELTLPGRPDLAAPLGDTEPEMTFWAAVIVRIAQWYDDGEMAAWIRRFPLHRLPAAALPIARTLAAHPSGPMPPAGTRTHHAALSTRSAGWESDAVAVAMSAARTQMGHLHHDGGHIVLGWDSRFWISDPGYQQYRHGAERDFTLGPQAHNAPVIDGRPQTARRSRVLAACDGHLAIDLTDCYEGLPATARIQRDVWLRDDQVAIRDLVQGIASDAVVHTHWLGGNGLAWAVHSGWARLCDLHRAVWLGTSLGPLSAHDLVRHEGSTGGLTLISTATGPHTRWWYMQLDRSAGWQPPLIEQREREAL